MNKKMAIALLLVLVSTTAFAGIASAKQLNPVDEGRNRPATIGQVASFEENHFTLEKPDGDQVTVQVTEDTRFRFRTGEVETGMEALSPGMWLAVAGQPDETGDIIARLVVLLPEDFDPEALRGRRIFGEVTHINNGQDTFTIITRSQAEITFQVDGSTRFLNGIGELKDLEKGMKVGILAAGQQNDLPFAKVVAAANFNRQQSQKRVTGKVETVSADSLSLELRVGRTLSFALTEETNFRSLDGSVESLQDLESGHVVVVIFEGDGEIGFTALNVIATGEALNQAVNDLQRVGGEVQSAGGSHLTIQTAGGNRMDFTVGENVRIRGASGEADLNDLKNGMRVVVLYNTDESGNLVARVILFGERGHAPPSDGSRMPSPEQERINGQTPPEL